MERQLDIGGRPVGDDHPVLVIAEIGVNHDGSEARALELVRAAAGAGADAVKLQLFSADRLMNGTAGFAAYQQSDVRDATAADMLRRYELPIDVVGRIVAAIGAAGMIPIATPFSSDDVAIVDELDLPAIKIASPDLVNRPLLQRASQSGRPLLVSCGASTIEEIAAGADWLNQWRTSFALLHCVSSYPTPADEAHLCWIEQLRRRFTCVVGYSDHTTDPIAGALSVTAGASIIEKHLTHDRSAAGPDHAASADPQQFAQYVRMVRAAERMRGRGERRVLPIERDVRAVSRQSLVLRQALPVGTALRREHLIVQRPGTGIPAAMIEAAVGRRLAVSLDAGTLLQWEMLTAT